MSLFSDDVIDIQRAQTERRVKLYQEENRRGKKAYDKEYYSAHKKRISKRHDKYYQAHKKQLSRQGREYYRLNKKKIKATKNKRKKEIKIYQAKYRQEHREKALKYAKDYNTRKRRAKKR